MLGCHHKLSFKHFPTDLCIPARKFLPEQRDGSTGRIAFVFSFQRWKDAFFNPSLTEMREVRHQSTAEERIKASLRGINPFNIKWVKSSGINTSGRICMPEV